MTTVVGREERAASGGLLDAYRQVRNASVALCRPLATEDYVIQSMPDVSPPKWHLAHTTWFFETFLLGPHRPGYRPFHPQLRLPLQLLLRRRRARGIRRAAAGLAVAADGRRGLPLPRRAWTSAMARAARGGVGDADLGGSRRSRARLEPRAAAPGAAGHGPQAQPRPSTLSAARTGDRPARAAGLAPPAAGWIALTTAGSPRSASPGDGFAFDNEGPRHAVYLARLPSWPPAW